ncbi:uncharacterized protein LOC133723218 [Rosa rugosa]|uniref:uncharacterized protein LOC133723218 n=1 Tax=Rosa rugosa TaxID=74645 RepID=UPI002B41456F|nr:uncharacterized protein LOC133723218 [Rosa rugosa]
MDHILFWNSRGAGSEKFRSSIQDLVKMHKVDLLFVCEPRIQFEKAKKLLLSLGFPDFKVREANGFSGGLWFFWNRNKVTIDIIDTTFQSIYVKVSWSGTQTWMLTGIYASPCNTSRGALWSYLDNLYKHVNLPGMIVGDFNELLSYSDKIGGSQLFRFGGLQDLVGRNGLIDMGYQGADYTVKERLDRCFCNCDWRILFPDACVVHLARMKSDHCPILVKLNHCRSLIRRNSPFRFQAMWMQHDNYMDMVKETWNSCAGDLFSETATLARSLNTWNKEIFGNIFKQKRILLARICGIQKSLGRQNIPFLLDLEKELIAKYEQIRDAEALFWKQKSRDKWLCEGDRNTKFFHLTTMIRRRRNKIDGLFDANGICYDNPTIMKQTAVSFFKNLFSAATGQDLRFLIPWLFPDVDANDLRLMNRHVSDNDVHDALFRIGKLKAPGADGFPTLFYQQHWSLCAFETNVVINAFQSGKISEGLIHTLITLVPKTQAPQHMHLFRPISLCCTIYKIISKIIVSRIRPLLGEWISPNQVSFVPGRHISDNIMIAQEILHKCKNSKGAKGFMAWKVLYEVNILVKLVKLIMSCVSTASYQIIVNGELSESFKGGRASTNQARVLKQCMDIFCGLSGQTVNDKSLVYCSPNIKSGTTKAINMICGSTLTDDLGIYLGMPLIHFRVTKNTYAGLVDKAQSRLASWKGKVLNMAGRLTLIQSVNSSIPIYAMQTAKLPMKLCDKLDKLNRDFLWGDTEQKRKVHLSSWDLVCRPKCNGGLGIKKTTDMNKAMLAKASWRVTQNEQGLWNKIYKEKYLHSDSLLHENYRKPPNCSSTWTGVVYGANLLRKGLMWRIGNGASTKFWVDRWTSCGILENYALNHDTIDINSLVQDFWINNDWNLPMLHANLPVDIVDKITAIPLAISDLPDKLIWGSTSSGIFSVKSAYKLLCDDQGYQSYGWLRNWSLPIPPKLKIFLWSFVSGKLLTNEQRVIRRIATNSSCQFCTNTHESMLHIFRDCPKAKQVWQCFNIPPNMLTTFNLCWKDWILANLLQKGYYMRKLNWNTFFIFCCWFLWKWRCKCVFDPNFCYPHNLADVVFNYADEWTRASDKASLKKRSYVELLSWIKPAIGVHKLNVDGSRTTNGSIGAGGVIRDNTGCWCGGFMINIGVGEVLLAEAWGLFHGLHLALSLKISKLEVESDSAILISHIQNDNVDLHPLGTLVMNCRKLMNEFVSIQIKHIHRERNSVADLLAKNNTLLAKGVCTLHDPPALVTEALLDDIVGAPRARSFSASNAG